jgi:hypothetical protein
MSYPDPRNFHHERPLRRIVHETHHGDWIQELLECGHTSLRYTVNAPAKKRRCVECASSTATSQDGKDRDGKP